jgi:hypothetical protein
MGRAWAAQYLVHNSERRARKGPQAGVWGSLPALNQTHTRPIATVNELGAVVLASRPRCRLLPFRLQQVGAGVVRG